MADVKTSIPRYCRVNRVIRDIPSPHVVAGNKRSSLRQDVHAEMARRGTHCDCIRCREVRGGKVEAASLRLDDLVYHPEGAEEHFLSFITPEDKIAGFLRLSLPGPDSTPTGLSDLKGAAIIREVHVYGQSLAVGAEQSGAAQHAGLGTRLLVEADRMASAQRIPPDGCHCGGGNTKVLFRTWIRAGGSISGENHPMNISRYRSRMGILCSAFFPICNRFLN